MSDLNDLIHTNAVVAFQQGEKTEQQRIIKLLDSLDISFTNYEGVSHGAGDALDLIALIKGEQK